jgi:hypothetical protein
MPRISTRVSGTDAFARKLARFADELGRESESLVKQHARALAVELGAKTGPTLGMGSAGADKMRVRINAEVRRTFASRQDPAAVYRLLGVHAPHLAEPYWHAYKSKKTRRMGQILTAAGLPTGASASALKTMRTGPTGNVPRDIHPLSLARESEVGALSRRQQLLVGVAKAGWHQAAKALGGRVRRNLVADDGSRKTEEIFPEYVRKVSRKFSGQLGGARFTGGHRASATVFSNVKHAEDAIQSHLIDQAKQDGRQKFHKALADSLRLLRMKTFRQSA